jgi:hypothetical protein
MSRNPKEEAVLNLIQEDSAYENYFFKKVSDVKWFDSLKAREYFSPQKAPIPYVAEQEGYFIIPPWIVLPYLERISQQLNKPENEKYIDELLSIIKEVTEYRINNDKILDNYRTWQYFVKILLNIPNDRIPNEIIDLIPTWLEPKFNAMLRGSEIAVKLLPKFLDGNNSEDLKKAEKIIEYITQIKWVPKFPPEKEEAIKEEYKPIFEKPEEERTEGENLRAGLISLALEKEPELVVDIHWLLESFLNQKNGVKVGEKCSPEVIYKLADRLKEIFRRQHLERDVDYSYIWMRSLFEPAGSISRTEKTITVILKEILDAKAKKDIKTTQEIFKNFLGEEYPQPLFKRFVLFVVGNNWENYKEEFWNILEKDEEAILFNDSHYEGDVYKILEKNIGYFTDAMKEDLKKIIEEKVPRKPHPEERHKEYYNAYRRQFWYSSIKTDPLFAPLYENYKAVTKQEDVVFKGPEMRVGPGPSPLNKEEILRIPNDKLAEYLQEFKTVDFWKGPTIGGLADILKEVAAENPEKFADDLELFLNTKFLYIYHILDGLRDAWKNKKPIDWKKLFAFIKEYIKQEEFWNDKHVIKGDEWETYHLWIIGIVGELIKQGTQDDTWAFSEDNFEIAEEIIFDVLDGMFKEKESILVRNQLSDDLISYTLNSSFGKITEALIILALRIKRFEESKNLKQSISWEVNIEDKYEELLKNGTIESYVWLGAYLVNFYYFLDKEWTIKKIETISPGNKQLWKAFISGYLFYSKTYDDLYKIMKPHYLAAIDIKFEEKNSMELERLVQHICVGYLRGLEDINDNDSLFRKILDKWAPSQIKEIIGFFWMQRDYLNKSGDSDTEIDDEKIKNRILDFWRWVYNTKYDEANLADEDKEIFSELSKLSVFLEEIDDEKIKWLNASASYVHLGYDSPFFIEYLDDLKGTGELQKTSKYIGKIFLKMLEKSAPDFDELHIKSIIEFLYKSGNKDGADKICDKYGSLGHEFVRPLYEQYNR